MATTNARRHTRTVFCCRSHCAANLTTFVEVKQRVSHFKKKPVFETSLGPKTNMGNLERGGESQHISRVYRTLLVASISAFTDSKPASVSVFSVSRYIYEVRLLNNETAHALLNFTKLNVFTAHSFHIHVKPLCYVDVVPSCNFSL